MTDATTTNRNSRQRTMPAERRPDNPYLHIYVRDHLAGAAAGSRRARRLASAESNRAHADELARLAAAIESDRDTLNVIADGLGIAPSRAKQLLARLGELAGLVKLNGKLVRRSPLSLVIETEALLMAVRGKLACWQALELVDTSDDAVPVDLQQLIDNANEQLGTLTTVHADAVSHAFKHGDASTSD